MENYVPLADSRRPRPLGGWIKGGVIILVHAAFTAFELPDISGLNPCLEHCAIKFYPTSDPKTALRISGLFISPKNTKRVDIGDLACISAPLRDERTDDILPHIVAGDLNVTSWQPLYREGLRQAALTELLSPEHPTLSSGSSIDKLLFPPGHYIPSTFLPSGGLLADSGGAAGEEPFFPASVVNFEHVGDHTPILLPLPCDADATIQEKREMRIKHLDEDMWIQKDQEMQGSLEHHLPADLLDQPKMVIDRCYARLPAAIREAFYSENRSCKRPETTDPMERFLHKHIRRPDMEYLFTAIELGDTYHIEQYMRRMSADGWKECLRGVNKRDTRAFFAYLTKSDCRKLWGFVLTETTPMKDDDGNVVVTHEGKSRLISESFRQRYSARKGTVRRPGAPITIHYLRSAKSFQSILRKSGWPKSAKR